MAHASMSSCTLDIFRNSTPALRFYGSVSALADISCKPPHMLHLMRVANHRMKALGCAARCSVRCFSPVKDLLEFQAGNCSLSCCSMPMGNSQADFCSVQRRDCLLGATPGIPCLPRPALAAAAGLHAPSACSAGRPQLLMTTELSSPAGGLRPYCPVRSCSRRT